jgi:hypothetical protein
MMTTTSAAVIVAIVAGAAAYVLWGPRIAVAVAVLAAVVAAVVATLRRNQRDLDELREREVAEDVKAALGDEDE